MEFTPPEPHILSELYGSIETRAGIGTWRFVFESQRLTWSSGIYDLLGLTRWSEPPSHDLFAKFIHPDDRVFVDDMAEYLSTVRDIDRELRIVHKNGSTIWCIHKAQVFVNELGECAFAVGILIDINHQKELQRERDFAEERLRTITTIALSFRWTVDPEGKKPPSQGWMDLTGQTAAEGSNMGWLDAIYEEDREKMRTHFIQAEKQKGPFSAKYRLRCRDGDLRWFIARYKPIFEQTGGLVEWLGVAIDISDLKPFDEPFYSSMELIHIDGAASRAARAILSWSVEKLSRESGLSGSSIRRLEDDTNFSARSETPVKALECFRKHGVEFFRFEKDGWYVRFRKTPGHSISLKHNR